MNKQQSKTTARNPFQDQAVRNQSPHWEKDDGEPASEQIPAALAPHPFVDAALTDQPSATEASEGISGMPEPEFEDEPARK